MRLLAWMAIALLVVGAGCLDGDSSAKARRARGELQDREAPPAEPNTTQDFRFQGRAESSFCLVTVAVCRDISDGTNSPWRVESAGLVKSITGVAKEIRGPGPYQDINAFIHVWLLDQDGVREVVKTGSFEFEVPASAHEIYLRVTFENNPNSLGPVPFVYQQAREFEVEGTLSLA